MNRWTLSIVVLGFVGLGAWDWYLRAHHYAQEAADLMNGGDAYPYIYADPSDLKEGKESARVWIGSAGGPSYYVSIWISPAEANRDANNPLYWSLSKYKSGKPLVYKGAVQLGYEITPGDYFVEISARNGTVVERLNIWDGHVHTPTDGVYHQTISLLRDGKELPVPSILIKQAEDR